MWRPLVKLVGERLAALCTWWVLAGWDDEDAAEVRRAIAEANKASAFES